MSVLVKSSNKDKLTTAQAELILQPLSELIQQRKSYLRGLVSIGENWISGKSFPPNTLAVEGMVRFLDFLLIALQTVIIATGEVQRIPEPVFGPIPAGGVGVELHWKTNDQLTVSFYNSGLAEVEVLQADGHYQMLLEQGEFDQVDYIILQWLIGKTDPKRGT